MKHKPYVLAGVLAIVGSLGAIVSLHHTYPRVVVLTYHRVQRHSRTRRWITISPGRFSREMSYLKVHYPLVTFAQYRRFLAGTWRPPGNFGVMVTVDDGTRNFLQEMVPILRRLQIPATSFVIGDGLRGHGDLMTKAQVADATTQAKVTVEAHMDRGHQHVRGFFGPGAFLITLGVHETLVQYRRRIAQDFLSIRERFKTEHLGVPKAVALPWGAGNIYVRQAAITAGFQYIFTENGWYATTPRMPTTDINRIDIGQNWIGFSVFRWGLTLFRYL